MNFKNHVKFNWVSSWPSLQSAHHMLHPLRLCVSMMSLTSIFASQVPSNADKQPIPDGEKVWPCQTLCVLAGTHNFASAIQELI